MSEILVGQAYWLAQLRYEQFSQGASIVEQQLQRLQALAKQPIVAQAQLGGAGAGSGTLAPPASRGPSAAPQIDADAAAYDRLQRAQAALEAQQARLARSQGDSARAAQLEAQAEERLQTVLASQNGITAQTIAVERQLTTVQQQAARGAQQAAQQQRQAMDSLRGALQPAPSASAAGGGVLGDLRSAAGLAGVGLGATQLVRFGESAITAANSLDRTEATVRALSGSQARYNQVLDVARTGQASYGGSLEENLRGLGTLVNLSNRAGVSLGTLDNISRRLAIVDPVQGIEGANIALKEFLSGNNAEAAVSLARRFELPKAALAELAKEGTTAQERLDGLNKLLNEQGITTQVLTDRTKTQAAIYDRMGAAALNARDAIGALLAVQGAPAAQSATGALTGVTQLVTAYNDLAIKNKNVFNVVQSILNPLQTYNSAVLNAGANVLAWAGNLVGTNGAVQQNAQVSLGAAADVERLAVATQGMAEQSLRVGGAFDDERQRLGQLQVLLGTSESDIRRSADASQLDSAQKGFQAQQTALLNAQTQQAVDGFLRLNPGIDASTAASLAAAQGYSVTEQRLIALQIRTDEAAGAFGRLTIAQNIAAGAAAALPETRRIGGTGNTVGGIASGIGGGAGALSARQDSEQQALQASRDALALARATTSAQRIAIYERQLARQATEEGRNRILAQIAQEKRGGAGRISAAQNTALQLNTVEQNSGLQLLKTQRENLERLADQAEDFDVRRSRAQEDFEEKRRKLLTSGQRLQASQLAQEFAKSQRRDQEDFDRQRRRTLRNNAEGTGDIGARTDLRQQQIGDRARLRGVATSGQRTPDLGEAPPSLGGGTAGGGVPSREITLRVQIAPSAVQIDGKTFVEIVWPPLEEKIDLELASGVIQSSTPGSGQTAVGGAG